MRSRTRRKPGLGGGEGGCCVESHAADMGLLGSVCGFCFLACLFGIQLSFTQIPLTLDVSTIDVNCSTVNTSQCTGCPQGTFSSNDSEACVCCESGFCLDVSECSPCPDGLYQPQTNQSSCLLCPEGFFANTSQSSECRSCPAGYYSNETASTSCEPCEKGFVSPVENATSCEPCLPGSYCSMTSCVTCTLCPDGQEAVNAGASECSLCPPGMCKGPKDRACVSCHLGEYQDAWGAERCDMCPDAHYCPSPDILPIACPEDAFCPAGSTAPSYCMETFSSKSGNSCTLSSLSIFLVFMVSLGVFGSSLYLLYKCNRGNSGRTRGLLEHGPLESRPQSPRHYSSSSPLLQGQTSAGNIYATYEREPIYAGW